MNTFLAKQGVTEEQQRNLRTMAGIMAIEALADVLFHSNFPAFSKTRDMSEPNVRITVMVERL